MATTNLGRIKPIHRGEYDPAFTYTPLDIVRHQGTSFFCIQESTGNAPQDGVYFQSIVAGDLFYARLTGGANADFVQPPQIDGQSLDDRYQAQVTGKGLSTNDYTDAEQSKLGGIQDGATQNATDAHLLARGNHTGTQPLSTLSDAGTAAGANVEDFDAAGSASGAVTAHEGALDPHTQYVQKITGKGLSTEDYTSAEKTKLAGIESGATADQTKADIDALQIDADTLDGKHAADFSPAGHHHDANYIGKTAETGGAVIPSGTTLERPSGTDKYLRYNTETGTFEGFDGTSWGSVGGGATGAGGNAVFVENDQVVTGDYTIPPDKNASSTGPITIADGVTVTVSDGARWVVL